ncbi:hypothetical protein KL933_004290 [Ogataea haglerorum]|uniref:Dihydroxyacetone kinase n=1 Tax=Ogataea haglerorum TaxID=1937702 RepID=A0AAN6D2G9_9ASCO|nr:uncharacterized protein KL911_004821 [Ogataea haglerorum]KAG7725276.1 hypothetical protein KL933_004290 [Ogataea haglerorum]KAG7746432.1 hypothetical protein KL912_004363 [Ogataea haglerorum]KAG7750089.1 hypothetical protein KL911_004821 [Ogataea haglerorum]
MSSKHWNYKHDLVHAHLKGLCHGNPDLQFIESERVVINKYSKPDKVMILSGGGSGHEPLHAGFVGEGCLDVGVAGFVFASPSTKQILSGLKAKPSHKGTLIVVKNYTGDILHFGLAAERAKAEGVPVELLIVQDDVSVGRTKNGMVGRRGLAGTALVHKIIGAKAARDSNRASLSEVYRLGEAVVANLVTIGASLDHCTIPGSRHHESGSDDEDEQKHLLGEDEIEVGMGIHNEAGIKRVSPIPTIDSLVADLLKYLLDKSDKERNYVDFDASDEVVLMINNLGGTSNLELYAIQNTVVEQLASGYKIRPARVYTGAYTTSLDGPGFSITLLNATKAGGKEVFECLDYPTKVPGWNSSYTTAEWAAKSESFVIDAPQASDASAASKVRFSGSTAKAVLESGCKKLLTKEPKITLYDTVAGDGDCGETLANGAHAILDLLAADELEVADAVRSLTQITDVVETAMGGTSGGLYSIFISALAKSLKDRELQQGGYDVTPEILAASLKDALDSLYRYTRARAGDRTLIDALAPFVEQFAATKGDLNRANKACHEGAESTRKLKAKFGRASYVSEDEFKPFEAEGGLPDPGAIGLAALVDGFAEAYSKIGSNL